MHKDVTIVYLSQDIIEKMPEIVIQTILTTPQGRKKNKKRT